MSGITILGVGAGPTCLTTAIRTKLQLPEAEVILVEKHTTYQRRHIVRLRPESLNGLTGHPLLASLVERLKKNHAIITSELEKDLSKVAHELGIKIIYDTVNDPTSLAKKYPNARYIIGGDGAHSVVRKQVFGDKMSYKADLHYVVQITYKVKGPTRALNLTEITKLEPEIGSFRPFEFIGSCNAATGMTPITLWILVDKATYATIDKTAGFKQCFYLNWEPDRVSVPGDLLSTIEKWLEARQQLTQESNSHMAKKINCVKLGVYSSQSYARRLEAKGPTYCLVGDAAFGVPFFRSLNNGMISAIKLSEAIVESILKPNPKSLRERISALFWNSLASLLRVSQGTETSMNRYCVELWWLSQKEYLVAHIKRLAIDLIRTALRVKKCLMRWGTTIDMAPYYYIKEETRQLILTQNASTPRASALSPSFKKGVKRLLPPLKGADPFFKSMSPAPLANPLKPTIDSSMALGHSQSSFTLSTILESHKPPHATSHKKVAAASYLVLAYQRHMKRRALRDRVLHPTPIQLPPKVLRLKEATAVAEPSIPQTSSVSLPSLQKVAIPPKAAVMLDAKLREASPLLSCQSSFNEKDNGLLATFSLSHLPSSWSTVSGSTAPRSTVPKSAEPGLTERGPPPVLLATRHARPYHFSLREEGSPVGERRQALGASVLPVKQSTLLSLSAGKVSKPPTPLSSLRAGFISSLQPVEEREIESERAKGSFSSEEESTIPPSDSPSQSSSIKETSE